MTRYEKRGEIDAALGQTACPYAVPANAAQWARGHDRMVNQGLGQHPRFGRICRRAGPSEGTLDL